MLNPWLRLLISKWPGPCPPLQFISPSPSQVKPRRPFCCSLSMPGSAAPGLSLLIAWKALPKIVSWLIPLLYSLETEGFSSQRRCWTKLAWRACSVYPQGVSLCLSSALFFFIALTLILHICFLFIPPTPIKPQTVSSKRARNMVTF